MSFAREFRAHFCIDPVRGHEDRGGVGPLRDPTGGPEGKGSFAISTDGREGLAGHWARTFPVRGGQYYSFRARRKVKNVAVPRRSVLARILWLDDQKRQVLRDEPGATSYRDGALPVAEPEYPADRATDALGWTEVSDTYRAPLKATRAIVELYLRWAPGARVEWSSVALVETVAPAPRTARLATVHFRPQGKKTAAENCRLFEPCIEEAARR